MELTDTLNARYMDAQYALWKQDSSAVSRDWQWFFAGLEFAPGSSSVNAPGGGSVSETAAGSQEKQAHVEALKHRYRDIGHLLAGLDPLLPGPESHPLLTLAAFDLTEEDLDLEFYTQRFSPNTCASLREIIKILQDTYCRSVGVEFMHLQDPEERQWLQDRMEPSRNRPAFDHDTKIRILNKLYQAAIFEEFLNKKYTGQTRFSLEGAESTIPLLDALLLDATQYGCSELILGMAHRGRLNVVTNILYKTYEEIFREFVNNYNPESLTGMGDVKYHNGYLTNIRLANGKNLRVFLVDNPSHLEAVDPVVEGIAHARQDLLNEGPRNQVLPLLIHGDAAFAGQGVVTETLNMSQLRGYRTQGTIHLIINNQIGFTTLPEHARSTRYSTDVAKMLMVPIFHVHGEDPEAVVHVARLADSYRMTFGKDVVIDLICYRRFGHNEGDEPYFTQPKMYDRIKERPPIHQFYGQKLLQEGIVKQEQLDNISEGISMCLNEAFKASQKNPRVFPHTQYYKNWEGYHGNYHVKAPATGVPDEQLLALGQKLNVLPEDFTPHPKLKRLMRKRLQELEDNAGIDWANAEALAFASLVSTGHPIRLSGQDVGRGTFSHRHCVLHDRKTEERYVPLNHVSQEQALFQVHNSMLSETAILGFEYGFSIIEPRGLVLWEAQFGDFANNAQTIIDLFISSGESKWQRLSGLVMLLPHGLEGLGPEHSSARLERFLLLCAADNMQVCNLSSPAQYFHCLRRQALSSCRKPLIVMSPKSLLRHPLAVSTRDDLTNARFQEVLDDPEPPERIKKVLLCSGKIYYELIKRRDARKQDDVAILRLEQFYPFPEESLETILAQYSKAREYAWVQEEPANMGAWSFLRHRLEALTGKRLKYIGRKTAASPSTGFANIYRQEQAAIVDEAVGLLPAKTDYSAG
ncbi:MAG: 2-oxoglutarate dehydrogenase E1 component [bacterium]|nr:2-oxoglutarate dehydrogenase E1 component [bacterium]